MSRHDDTIWEREKGRKEPKRITQPSIICFLTEAKRLWRSSWSSEKRGSQYLQWLLRLKIALLSCRPNDRQRGRPKQNRNTTFAIWCWHLCLLLEWLVLLISVYAGESPCRTTRALCYHKAPLAPCYSASIADYSSASHWPHLSLLHSLETSRHTNTLILKRAMQRWEVSRRMKWFRYCCLLFYLS